MHELDYLSIECSTKIVLKQYAQRDKNYEFSKAIGSSWKCFFGDNYLYKILYLTLKHAIKWDPTTDVVWHSWKGRIYGVTTF